MSDRWQPIETAPKHKRTVIDLWCVGPLEEIRFYCPVRYGVKDQILWQGRVTDVSWRDGDWRPVSGLRMHRLEVTPTHWMPHPEAPDHQRMLAALNMPVHLTPRSGPIDTTAKTSREGA